MLSRLALTLLISGFIPLNSFGRWEAQSAPTLRTSGILATHLVRTEGKVEAHRESPRILSCLTLVLLEMGGGFVWLGLWLKYSLFWFGSGGSSSWFAVMSTIFQVSGTRLGLILCALNRE